jgi:hypothetical protein
MHSIRLDIQDSVFDKVIYFLNTLPKNKVVIKEETNQELISQNDEDSNDTKAFSNHSALLIEEWSDESEDAVWK